MVKVRAASPVMVSVLSAFAVSVTLCVDNVRRLVSSELILIVSTALAITSPMAEFMVADRVRDIESLVPLESTNEILCSTSACDAAVNVNENASCALVTVMVLAVLAPSPAELMAFMSSRFARLIEVAAAIAPVFKVSKLLMVASKLPVPDAVAASAAVIESTSVPAPASTEQPVPSAAPIETVSLQSTLVID